MTLTIVYIAFQILTCFVNAEDIAYIIKRVFCAKDMHWWCEGSYNFTSEKRAASLHLCENTNSDPCMESLNNL